MIKTDCRHFRGDIPCLPHKLHHVHCSNCEYYDLTKGKILVIKLGAIGDVIRTTPLLRKIKETNPQAQIFWLTYTPEVLTKEWVDRILPVTIENIELIKSIEFDWLINLDKDALAISLANSVKAVKKSGFKGDGFGHAEPISTKAEEHKWLTGLFDDMNRENTKHYVQEMFEICGYEFNDEEYIVPLKECDVHFKVNRKKKSVIGLNTGCGGRWTSRLWPENYWIDLAKMLIKNNYEVILLGGEQEHEKNLRIKQFSGAKYFGFYPLNDFMHLIDSCDTVVSAVTMAMHLTIGLKKNLVLFNNIFNKNEFYLYGRGMILEPDFACDCYYSPSCKNNCMQYLSPEKVFKAIESLN